MRDALLVAALCCAELASLMIAFSWLMIPGASDFALYPLWIGTSMIGGFVAAIWSGHAILERFL